MKRVSDPDLYYYSPWVERPRITWPNNARVAFWVAPNVEFYELLPPQGPGRSAYPRPAPDIGMYTIRDYGNRLFRKLQLGNKKRNDGVLILVAPNEHKVSIEVGYGLEGDLTDAMSRIIIENAMIPRFKTGDWAGGLYAGLDDIQKVVGGQGDEVVKRVESQSAGSFEDANPSSSFSFSS